MAKVKRIIYPPMWLAIGIIVQFGCNEYFPGASFATVTGQVIGGVILVAGLALLVVAGGLFKKADTDLIPFRNVTALVTSGVYRFTRNPQYLGDIALVAGYAILCNSQFVYITGLIGILWFLLAPFTEEPWLRREYGEAYERYASRVPRFITFHGVKETD